MLTKSYNNMTFAPIIGEDVCLITKKSTGVVSRTFRPLAMLPTAYPTLGKSSSFTYVQGPKALPIIIGGIEVMVPVFKPATHITTERTARPGNISVFKSENSVNKYERIRCGAPGNGTDWLTYYSINSLVSRGLMLNPDTVWANWRSNATSFGKTTLLNDSALLGFKDSFNVLNFIAELKDVRRLPELVTKWTKGSHDVSDKFLGVNFGVLPFASDIISIADRVRKLGPAIDKWNDLAKNGKVINFHRIFPIEGLGTKKGTPKSPFWEKEATFLHSAGTCSSVAPGGASNIRINVKQTFKALVHIYVVPVTVEPDLIDDIKRDVWGVNKPLTALWNALPFSFVVDWFTGLGESISRFEQSKPHLRFKIVSAGFSLKVNSTVTFTWTTGTEGDNLGTVVTNFTHYYREPIDPTVLPSAGVNYSSLQFQLIDQKQALLGSALMHQLLR